MNKSGFVPGENPERNIPILMRCVNPEYASVERVREYVRDRIEEVRKSKRMSYEDLVSSLDIKEAEVSAMLTGKKEMNYHIVGSLLFFLNIYWDFGALPLMDLPHSVYRETLELMTGNSQKRVRVVRQAVAAHLVDYCFPDNQI